MKFPFGKIVTWFAVKQQLALSIWGQRSTPFVHGVQVQRESTLTVANEAERIGQLAAAHAGSDLRCQ